MIGFDEEIFLGYHIGGNTELESTLGFPTWLTRRRNSHTDTATDSQIQYIWARVRDALSPSLMHLTERSGPASSYRYHTVSTAGLPLPFERSEGAGSHPVSGTWARHKRKKKKQRKSQKSPKSPNWLLPLGLFNIRRKWRDERSPRPRDSNWPDLRCAEIPLALWESRTHTTTVGT